jgi:hypothetical protein
MGGPRAPATVDIMSNTTRRGAGFALLGLALWGVAAVLALLTEDMDFVWFRLVLGVLALAGIVLALGGIIVSTFGLIRGR